MALPLSGYRLLDFGQFIAGPAAAMLLADQGVDVIKVEAPTGDVMRPAGPSRGGVGAAYMHWNRNKRSLCVDLGTTKGKKLIHRLVRTCDVVLHNFRPGVEEKLGLGEAELRALNPKLIYASIAGFGHEGPISREAAYDSLIQAMSGFGYSQTVGGEGPPYLVRSPFMDKLTGVAAAQAITAALCARERTGEGSHIRLSMLDIGIEFAWADILANQAFIGEHAPVKTMDRGDWLQPTADGFIACQPVGPKEMQIIAALTGHAEFLEDERFNTMRARTLNLDAFCLTLKTCFKTHPTEYWVRELRAAGLACAPMLSPEQIVANDQVAANNLFSEEGHPLAGRVRTCRSAARFDDNKFRYDYPAPSLGEHTDQILSEMGVGDDELAQLRELNVVG